MRRFSIRVIHRRGGKTVKAIMTLISRALASPLPQSRYAYIAPLLKQAKTVAWDYLKHYALKIPGTKVNEVDLSVEFPTGARIRLFGADNPDSLRGVYFDGVVLDEVAQMKAETWGEIIQPAIADREGWVLFIGTPKGINLFSELYYKHLNDPEWSVIKLGCYDTDALAPNEIARLKGEMSDAEFRQEMLCDFSAATTDTLISFDLVEAAVRKQYRYDQYDFAPRILGVDVAFAEDGDRSVIFPRQGLVALEPIAERGIDNMQLADRIARRWDEWKASACFIDAGRGEGVYSRLVQLGYTPQTVDFGGKAGSPRYVNKKTEMWFDMWAWLREGGAIPNRTDLKQDLCTPKYDSNNAANKLQLERKERIRERGLPSPDLGDALALTFAYPVAPLPIDVFGQTHAAGKVLSEWDPYDPSRL